MRTFTRKLLSLLLAFTMVCAMVPAALADGPEEEPGPGTEEDSKDPVTVTHDATHTEFTYEKGPNGQHTKKCKTDGCDYSQVENCSSENDKYQSNAYRHYKTCKDCGNEFDEGVHTIGTNEASYRDESYHSFTCSVCESEASAQHTWAGYTSISDTEHSYYCSVCQTAETQNKFHEAHNFEYKEITADTHVQTCKNCTYVSEAIPHKYENGKCVCGQREPEILSITPSSVKLNGRKDSASLSVTVADGYDVDDVKWEITRGYNYVDLYRTSGRSTTVYPISNGSATITAYLYADGNTYSDTCTVTVSGISSDISAEVTVFNTNPGYALGDKDDDGYDSVVDQIWDEIDDITDGDEELYYVEFYSPVEYNGKGELDVSASRTYYYEPFKDSQYDLSDVVFIPDEEYKGDVTFNFLAVDTDNYEYEGEVTFKVEEGAASAGDIIYTAKNGEDVEFDVDDFEDFWDDNSSKGSLDYVTFDSVTKGDLVDEDGDDIKTGSKATECYVDPGKNDTALDGITFEPSRNTKTTVTIGFTAHGSNKKEISGTVVILYTEKEPEAIVYNSTGKNITLDADDFLDNYKDTVGSSASNIQIQFLDAPSNGTLYYNYNEKTEKGTELTSKNVQNYTFSTNTRASRSIEDVTYVPDSRGRTDTIKFAAYTSSGELRYYGEVTFGQTVQNVSVSMTSTSAGVTFQTSSFTGADSAMLTVSSISFGTPSSGTLYKNWTGTSGTRVTASDMFSYVASVTGNPSLSTVTYVPVAGYSGNVTIPFSAYSTTGNSIINGTVTIRVTATTTTTVFTDVPTTGSQAWAAPYISRLYNAGVVSGVTPTTYGPKQAVKWGEALKMVLRAAGYPAQTEGTGSNWAANYLTYAYNNGLVSSNSIDLNSNITRLEMAELAAKALKMSPASRINSGIVGPTDTTNGYVYALYNAGIVGGDSSSGQNRYNGGSSLNRDEMAKIVCGVMDYNG